MKKEKRAVELDWMQMLGELWNKAGIIILVAAIFAGAAFAWTYYMIKPQYEASVMLYVNNTSISVESVGVSISSSDLTAAQKLVDTYVVILKTRPTLNDVISEAELDMSPETLSGRISAGPVNSTEIFRIKVWDYNPNRAEKIANTIAKVLPDKISSIVDGSSVRIVETAVVPSHRSSPSYSNNTFLGFIIGAIVAAVLILLRRFADPYVKNEDEITQTYGLPLLAVIPRVRNQSEGSGYYSRGNRYYYRGYYGNNSKNSK